MEGLFNVAFFDSGIGGLNILNACKNKLKNQNFIYLGDNKNTPYGSKSLDFLKNRTDYAFNIFKSLRVRCVVIACNTLSVSIGDYIKNKYDMEVVLTLPIKPLNYKRPILLSTPLTAKSDFVKNLYSKNDILPLPRLALDIENNLFNFEKINLLSTLKKLPDNADSIVLGCTHYIFLKSYIEKITNLPVLSSSEVVANTLVSKLYKNNLISDSYSYNLNQKGRVLFVGENSNYNSKVYNSFFN